MTETISADISYIKEIQNSMLQDEGAWPKLVWYLLHHNDVDLQTAHQLYLNNDPKYNEWLREHDIEKVDPDKSAEEVLLAYITDYIEVVNNEGDVNVQEFFMEKDRKLQEELERKQAELMARYSSNRNNQRQRPPRRISEQDDFGIYSFERPQQQATKDDDDITKDELEEMINRQEQQIIDKYQAYQEQKKGESS